MGEIELPSRMSAPDAVMWDIEKDPILRSTITAIAVLDRPPDWERLRARVDWGSRLVPRLRQKVVVPMMHLGPPRWVADRDFDLDYHLRRVVVPPPGGMREVLDLVQPMAIEGFDRARPLWEFTLIEGVEGGGAALVQKVHHSLTDGVGGIRLATMLLDDERDPPRERPPVALPPPGPTSRLAVTAESVGEGARALPELAVSASASLLRGAWALLRRPASTIQSASEAARSIIEAMAPVTEPGSPLLRGRSLGRRFDILEVRIDDLRAAGRAAGGTVNDAFLAAVLGGMALYHERHGAHADELRVTMPVNFRSEDDPLGGNRFAPARFAAPASVKDPLERMRVIGGLARRWRTAPVLEFVDPIAAALDVLPSTVLTSIFGGMLKAIDVVVTNVPGIDHQVFLAGSSIEREFAFAPPTGAATSVALLSHAGRACVGIVSDTAAVPDPPLMVECLAKGFDEVIAVAGSRQPVTGPSHLSGTERR